MEEAKPWWQSKTILALIAGLILLVGTKFDLLPEGITQDRVVEFLLVAVPIVVGIFTRFTSTKQVTTTAAKAEDINLSSARNYNQ